MGEASGLPMPSAAPDTLNRTLVIECATEACSVALFEGDTLSLVDARHEVLGRGHAERLIPMIAELPEKGRAGHICVSLGPGSFTGVRIGIAAARALGIAWGAHVTGYPTLALIAAGAQSGSRPVTVCMEGGHSQWFIQNFDGRGGAQDLVQSLPYPEAAKACRHPVIAGNRAAALAQLLEDGREVIEISADARHFPFLHHNTLTDDLTPLYGRAPDAKPANTLASQPQKPTQ